MSQRRLQQLEENLSRILGALKTYYAPEQVIVFGSLASGNVTDTSDLDLLIVKNTDKRFFDRIREVVKICDYDIGVDFLVYTPQELSEAAIINPFVRDEILSKGKVVYRAAA
jgi:predicted nucleotidyltransferase